MHKHFLIYIIHFITFTNVMVRLLLVISDVRINKKEVD